jgi:hypothetical protein
MGGYYIIVCAWAGTTERDSSLFPIGLVLVVSFSMLFLLFARLGRGEYLIGLRASVEYYGVSSRRTGKNMGDGQVKKETRIQQHGEELIDVCFMDMADRSNYRRIKCIEIFKPCFVDLKWA